MLDVHVVGQPGERRWVRQRGATRFQARAVGSKQHVAVGHLFDFGRRLHLRRVGLTQHILRRAQECHQPTDIDPFAFEVFDLFGQLGVHLVKIGLCRFQQPLG